MARSRWVGKEGTEVERLQAKRLREEIERLDADYREAKEQWLDGPPSLVLRKIAAVRNILAKKVRGPRR